MVCRNCCGWLALPGLYFVLCVVACVGNREAGVSSRAQNADVRQTPTPTGSDAGDSTHKQMYDNEDSPLTQRYGFRGRVDFADPLRPRFEWENAGVGVHFRNSRTISVNIVNVENRTPNNTLVVMIDGIETRKIIFSPNETTYEVAENLTLAEHTVWLYKAQEFGFGPIEFSGFNLGDNAELLAPPKVLARRIEFVGSSTLTGWGSDGGDFDPLGDCDDEVNFPTTNAQHAIPRYTADYLEMDFQNLSRGAAGIVLTFAKGVMSLPSTYDFLTSSTTTRWDFNRWTAEVVVVEAGGSDFMDGDTVEPQTMLKTLRGYRSSDSNSKETIDLSEYREAYRQFVETIRARHPGALVVLVDTKNEASRSREIFFETLDEVAAGFTDGRVVRFNYFTTVTSLPQVYNDYRDMIQFLGQGCQDHPTPMASQYMAARLADFIKGHLRQEPQAAPSGVAPRPGRKGTAGASHSFAFCARPAFCYFRLRTIAPLRRAG